MKLAGRYLLWCVVCLCLLSCSTQKEEEEIRFAIVSDLHAPDLPDGKERMQAVVEAANKEDVDFLIQLGDFIRLDSVSMPLREVWNGFKGETFHVLGNHDLDKYSKEEFVASELLCGYENEGIYGSGTNGMVEEGFGCDQQTVYSFFSSEH